MKILIVDKYAMCLDFAWRCKDHGHEVRWYVGKDPKTHKMNHIGDGFGIDRRNEWESSAKWADIIFVPTNAALVDEMDRLIKRGFPVFGPPKEGVLWETERAIGQKIFEECGIDTMAYTEFKTIKEARAWLKANPGRYVSKGDNYDDKSLSYVSKSAKDLEFMMNKWDAAGKIKGSFILQEFTPGIEVAVGGWFGKHGFSKYFLENFEHKKLMNGDVGVNTGEMGTVMKYTEKSALAEHLLRPLEGHLHRIDYRGFIDVSVIVAKDGTPYPLEFTCRPGWPLFDIQQSLHPDPCMWMYDMLCGRDTFKPSTDVAVGLQIGLWPFPTRCENGEAMGYPIYGWDAIPPQNIHLGQVAMGMAPNDKLKYEMMPVSWGTETFVVSGNGSTVSQAQMRAYKHLSRIEIPNSPMYRTDIGERVKSKMEKMQGYGWCEDWTV